VWKTDIHVACHERRHNYKENRMFESEKYRAAVVSDLGRLCDPLRFRSGAPICRTTGLVSLRLAVTETDDQELIYRGSVFAGYPPPPAVAGLHWALTTVDGDPVAAGQTGRRGEIAVRLDRGEVGDHELRLKFDVGREERPQPIRRIPHWAVHVPTTVLSLSSRPGDELRPGDVWGLSQNGRLVVIAYPIENRDEVDFPYGLARLEYVSKEGVREQKLVPISRNAPLGIFEGRTAVSAVLPAGVQQCEPGQLHLEPVLDRDSISVGELQELIARNLQVRNDPELKKLLQSLV
jgi:hypothetical protein